MLPTDLLMVITKKVATFGTQDLLNFGSTSKLHHQLANKKATLRALNQDCLWYIVDPNLFLAKRRFVCRMSSSRHSSYSVAIAVFMLHQIRPDLERIKQTLAKAMKNQTSPDLERIKQVPTGLPISTSCWRFLPQIIFLAVESFPCFKIFLTVVNLRTSVTLSCIRWRVHDF